MTTPTRSNASTRTRKKASASEALAGLKEQPAAAPTAPASSLSTSDVLAELKSLAKELNKAAKGLGKAANAKPREVSAILGNVERMTMDAANKSLHEAESAKLVVGSLMASLNHDWSRQNIEQGLKTISDHLTNIIVAQEFQDLAGQSIRKAMKALVGAIVVEAGGPTDEGRLSQAEADALIRDLMP